MIKEVKELLIQELSKNMSHPENQDKIKKISSAKSWGELGISIEDGIKLLKEHGMKVVLDEADKIITENSRDYSSWDSLVGIHMTNYMPRNETIYTPQSAKKEEIEFVILLGKVYEMTVTSTRNTIHMVINNEVEDIDGMAYWGLSKYAVLIPLKDIPKEQIKSGNPIDTFVEGNLQLNEQCWVLCPSGEEETLRKNNPNINILGYNGELVRGYAATFASALGYRVESHDNTRWLNTESAEEYSKLMKNEDFPTDLLHIETVYKTEEYERMRLEVLIQTCIFIKEHNFITAKEDIPEFIKSIFVDSYDRTMHYDSYNIQGMDELKEKYNKSEFDVEDRARSLDDYLRYGIYLISNSYDNLEEHGISIPDLQKNIIDRLKEQDFWVCDEDLISILNEEKKNTDNEEEQDFINRVLEQVGSKVKYPGISGCEMDSTEILLLNVLFEGIVKSRNKELKKSDSDSNRIIESLSGQVIPEMANVQLEDETQRKIISQERQIENTKDKQRS